MTENEFLHVNLAELAVIARLSRRTDAQAWALNTALAALDPERDDDLVAILTAIRDALWKERWPA